MSDTDADIQLQMRALQLDYAARLPSRTADIAARFEALRAKWCPNEATELRRLVHNLAGSGASYGFPAVSSGARLVERALDATIETAPTSTTLDAVSDALRGLVGAAMAARLD
jgi:HPt (histidine-containing phosphotransfer) domain-containing protein